MARVFCTLRKEGGYGNRLYPRVARGPRTFPGLVRSGGSTRVLSSCEGGLWMARVLAQFRERQGERNIRKPALPRVAKGAPQRHLVVASGTVDGPGFTLP